MRRVRPTRHQDGATIPVDVAQGGAVLGDIHRNGGAVLVDVAQYRAALGDIHRNGGAALGDIHRTAGSFRHQDGATIPVDVAQGGAMGDIHQDGATIPVDVAQYRAALGDIHRNGGAVLVAERAGGPVGVCQLIVFRHLQARGGLCAEVESMHVHPEHRNGGVGAALLGEAIVRARALLGCYRIQRPPTRPAPMPIGSTSGSVSSRPTSASRCSWGDRRTSA